jgi:hypothetical protein
LLKSLKSYYKSNKCLVYILRINIYSGVICNFIVYYFAVKKYIYTFVTQIKYLNEKPTTCLMLERLNKFDVAMFVISYHNKIVCRITMQLDGVSP